MFRKSISTAALLSVAHALPQAKRFKRYQAKHLGAIGRKNLQSHLTDHYKVTLSCIETINGVHDVTDTVSYFFKGVTVDDIIDPDAAKYPGRDGQAGNWFTALHETADLQDEATVSIKIPNDANVDNILEAPWPIDDSGHNFDTDGNEAYVHCGPEDSLQIGMKAYVSQDFVEFPDYDGAWGYHTDNHEEFSCLGENDEV